MNSITLKSFPMPISQNKAYRNLSFKGMKGRAKTSAYLAFERAASIWAMQNNATLNMAREMTRDLGSGYVFKMTYFFYFKEDRIIMQHHGKEKRKGDPKVLDTSNRLKCLEDVLFSLLGIGDEWAWAGSYDKGITAHEAFPECVDISIDLVQLKLSTAGNT